MTVGLLSFGANRSVHNGGLSQTNFQGVEFMFLNSWKAAQDWQTITGANYCDPDPSTGFNFDANGYARNIPVGTGGLRALHVLPTDTERSWSDYSTGVGAYTHTWDGGGTIHLNGFTLVSSNTPGGNLVSAPGSTNNMITLRPTSNRPQIGVSAVTSSTDYPHNFNLYYTADQADVDAGYIMSAKARERWAEAKFGAGRFLNWQAGNLGGGNDNQVPTWELRKPVGHWSYGVSEIRTAIYAGVTSWPTSTDHYELSTFNHPVYGTAAAVDKQMIIVKWHDDLTFGQQGYLTYNGREDPILRPNGDPAIPASQVNTGIPGAGMYASLMYDSLLGGWINFGSGNEVTTTSTFLQNGVPPEIQLQAAIEMRFHPHFLTPTYAADSGTGAGALTDYMSNFIDYVRANAPSWMVPIWEPPNEWWNSQFFVYHWSNVRQRVRNGGALPGQTAVPFKVTSLTYGAAVAVTGTGAGASGKVRLTVGSTASLTTGEIRTITSVGGTAEANGVWPITVIDGTHVDLDGSVYVNAWTSGGSISGQATMQGSGTLPPLGARLVAINNQPSGLSGFNQVSGYVTSVGASSFTLDSVPTAGSWAGNSGTATLTLVGSTVSVPYTTAAGNAIVFTTTGSLPSPLVAGTVYYVLVGGTGGTPFQVSASFGGSAVDFSAGSQSGTHTGTQVIALSGLTVDYHNAYGTCASNLGQLLMSKYGASDPKTQTSYKMVIGLQASTGSSASNAANSDPRVTSKHMVIRSASGANQAKLYATHVSPASYFHWAAYASGTQETDLANAWNGTLFTCGIVNGVMTVASFQNAGTTNMANGQVVFGLGLPAPFGANQVTIASGPGSGTGVYTLSDLTINVPSGTQLYSGVLGAGYDAVKAYIDSTNQVQVTATISNGSGSAGNQFVVSAITPASSELNTILYNGSLVRGGPINADTTITSIGSTGGGTGTYTISRSTFLQATSASFTVDGNSGIQRVRDYHTTWKTWALGLGINKMLFYEGGYSPDLAPSQVISTSSNVSKSNLLKFAAKWVVTSTCFADGTKGMLRQNYAYCDALTDGTFTAEYPSSYYFDGRYPSNNAWSIWENIYLNVIPPLVQANIDYNA